MQSLAYIPGSDGSANASLMTITQVRTAPATTITVNTVAGAPAKFFGTMGTPHTFTDPVTGETITIISEATAVDFAGRIDSGKVEIDQIAPGYTDLGSKVGDIIIIRPITEWANTIFNVLSQSMLDDGKLKNTALNHFFKPSDVVHNSVAVGGVIAQSSGLIGTFSNIEYYINGLRYTKSSIANKTYTASRDTYVDIDTAGNVTYVEATNGATSGMTLTANSIRVAKVVTSGSAITSVTQFGTDPLGNLIYPFGAVGASNIDFNSFLKPKRVQGSNQSLAQPGTYITTTYTFAANVPHLLFFNAQQVSFNNTGSVWQFDIRVDGSAQATSRSEGNGQHPQPVIGLYTSPTTASRTVTLLTTRLTGGAAVDVESPVLLIVPLPALGTA